MSSVRDIREPGHLGFSAGESLPIEPKQTRSVKRLTTNSPDYRLLVSGAGPGGLTSALETVKSGIVPKGSVVVLEARDEAEGGAHNAWGSRSRTVVLDDETVHQHCRLGVEIPGAVVSEVHIYSGNKGYVFPNREGVWKQSFIYALFRRRISRVTQTGPLERETLKTYREHGGKILFGTKAILESTASGVIAHLSDGSALTSHYALIAEGAKSENRQHLGIGMSPVDLGPDPNYLGLDFTVTKSDGVGRIVIFFDEAANLSGYGFLNQFGGSIGMPVTAGIDPAKREEQFHALLNKMRVSVGTIGPIYSYAGNLAQADRVVDGKIFMVGEATRSTDPASGNGLNTAAKDAAAVPLLFAMASRELGEYFLLSRIRDNTRQNLSGSWHFRNIIKWVREQPQTAKVGFELGVPADNEATAQAVISHAFRLGTGFLPKWAASMGASAIFSMVGAPKAPGQGGPDPTRELSIHGSSS